MNKETIKKIVLWGGIGILILIGISSYNGLVSNEETVDSKWSDVENQYKRRFELYDNLFDIVRAYADHESSTFKAVVEARAKATQIKIDGSNMTKENLKEFEETQARYKSAFDKLLAINENYPQLKANENFKDLQVQVEGTENRIAFARGEFIISVKQYNTSLRTFPTVIFAKVFGFEKREYFETSEAEEVAPKFNK